VAIRSDLLAKLKKDNPRFTGSQMQLVEIASRGAKRKMGIPETTSFDNIHDWVRTKAGGQERTGIMGALETAGTALMEGPIGKNVLTPLATTLFGKEGVTEESRTGRELMQIEDAAKVKQDMDAFKQDVGSRIASNQPVAPEEKARYDELKKLETTVGKIQAAGKSIPALIQQIKDNPGDSMSASLVALLDPREIRDRPGTAPAAAAVGGFLEGGSMLGQRAYQATRASRRLRRGVTEGARFAGEAGVQGSLSEAARSGENTPEGFAGNLATGAAMAGAGLGPWPGNARRAGNLPPVPRAGARSELETHVARRLCPWMSRRKSFLMAVARSPRCTPTPSYTSARSSTCRIQEKAKQIAEIESEPPEVRSRPGAPGADGPARPLR
jgi:hypothetical protein